MCVVQGLYFLQINNFKIVFQDQYIINLNRNKCKIFAFHLMTPSSKRSSYQYFRVKTTYQKYPERVPTDVHLAHHTHSLTSRYWPTQKACIDSRVSSNCKAASKATTGSSPTNWAEIKQKKVTWLQYSLPSHLLHKQEIDCAG